MKNVEKSKLIACGRQNCADMHSCGPEFRTQYIIHYIIHGSGYFVCEGKKHRITAGQSFVIRPFTEIQYYPDKEDPWEYTWIEFTGKEFLSSLLNAIKWSILIISKSSETLFILFFQNVNLFFVIFV